MASLFDLTIMTVSSAFGTGATIPLGSAATVNGVTYLSFANAGATGGTSVFYSILDTGASEVGTATYTSSNTTLTSRTPVKSTNGGAAINASSAAIVLCTPQAEALFTTAATKTDQQTGTSTTVAVTPSQQQSHKSAAKAWITFTGSSTAVLDSYNMSVTTHPSLGRYTLTFATAFSSTSYVCAFGLAGPAGVMVVNSKTTSVLDVSALTIGGVNYDPTQVDIVAFGNQ